MYSRDASIMLSSASILAKHFVEPIRVKRTQIALWHWPSLPLCGGLVKSRSFNHSLCGLPGDNFDSQGERSELHRLFL